MVADQLALSTSDTGPQSRARAAFFVSDSTGITAETLGSALLANFPGVPFSRHTIPFVDTVEGARAVAARHPASRSTSGGQPVVFTTVKSADILRRAAGAGSGRHRPAGRAPDRTRGRAGHDEVRAAGAVPRRGRHRALLRPDARGRVRDRARRRSERARARHRRRDHHRPVSVRQDADHDVPRAAVRAARRELSAHGRRLPHR